ncbi:MAG: threonylcarbamoyl-AMP synthase [Proteobacteria bacterium]|nr:threonylcarbamoyl-AMP synthase [Pseudomonadota bacterium]
MSLQDIKKAISLLNQGNLVAFPTETVYGLGADFSNEEAIKKIYALKRRPHHHPLIIHVANLKQARNLAFFDESALLLAQKFWPGPMTLILQKKDTVSTSITGGQESVGIRVPNHPTAQNLLNMFGKAIAAPSANKFGHVSPTSAKHVKQEFGDDVFILDGGSSNIGIESTIIDLYKGPSILRPGFITKEQITSIIGPLSHSETRAPGVLKSHYAPKTKLILSPDPQQLAQDLKKQGLKVAILPALDPETHAQSLYKTLRKFDSERYDIIIAEPAQSKGLGIAINDRLKKASYSKE